MINRKSILAILAVLLIVAQPTFASSKDEAPRSRIAWDKSTLVEIFEAGNYARIIELSDGSYFAVAGGRGGVATTRSFDQGKTWEKARLAVIDKKLNNKSVSRASVPEIMEISNGDLLLTYNPRPNEDIANGLPYGIRAVLSSNKGESWSDEIFVFDAHSTFADGCWEPQTIELPSGEIQLYFANEKPYTKSNEQNISMCRSFDGGKSWGEAEMVSFRAGHRDGMPVAVYLEHSGEIVVAIEDNGITPRRMRPTIVRSKKLWYDGAVLSGKDEMRRDFALTEPLKPADNGAAPYIAQAANGEIILSYQGSEGRDVPIKKGIKTNDNSQEMFVAVGDRDARNFTNKSTPFNLPLGPKGVFPSNGKGYQGMWNSVATTKDGGVWAISSTNAYKYPHGGVYGIKGYLLGDIIPAKRGAKREDATPDIMIAHTLESQMYGYTSIKGSLFVIDMQIKNIKKRELSKSKIEIQLSSKDGSKQLTFAIPCKGKTEFDAKAKSKVKYSSSKKTCEIELSINRDEIKNLVSKGWIYLNATLTTGEESESINLTTDEPATWLRVAIEK